MTASVLILFVLAAVLLIAWVRGWYVTVPTEPPGTADVPVTLSTSTGTSNPVTFTYGS